MSSININYEGKTESHEMEALPKQPEGVGGGCEIIELTQKEYDDLPDTKLTDGKLYKIKDVNINGDATTVTYVDPDGNKTNVASELDKVNDSLSELNSNLSNSITVLSNSITVLRKQIDASEITLAANGGIGHVNIISKMGISNEYIILGYPTIDIWNYGHFVIPVPLGNDIRFVNVGDISVTLTTVVVWVVLKKI